MADHLDKARAATEMAQKNAHIEAIQRAALNVATAHALIDIAESLRALRPPAPAPNARRFGDRVVHLAELPLEVVGGCDDEAAS